MAIQNITSANSSLRITITTLYPSGVDVDGYEADRMFETAAVENAEFVMGADGQLYQGWIPNMIPLTINIMPNSSFGQILDELFAYENTSKSKLSINAVLTVPALDATFTYVNGGMATWTPSVTGARVLQGRPAIFNFESVTRS